MVRSDNMENGKVVRMISAVIGLFLAGIYLFSQGNIGASQQIRGVRYQGGGAYIGANPSLSPDGSKIVFGAPRDGIGDIYSMNLDGSDLRRLTATPEYEGEPVFSSDGSQIMFVSEQDGPGRIYLMNADGSNQRVLTSTESYDSGPRFSPDGSKIVFVRQGAIFIMDADGSNQAKLTITRRDGLKRGSPSFSPDGKKILYQSVRYDEAIRQAMNEIWTMNSDGTEAKRLHENGYVPAYSPNGNAIVFIGKAEVPFEHEIYIMDADGSSVRPLTRTGGFKDSPVFVPDGSRIVFLKVGPGGRSGTIQSINSDGSDLESILKIY